MSRMFLDSTLCVQAAVEKQISHLLDKREAEEHLQQLQCRKDALQAERDAKQQQRGQLDLQLMRLTQACRDSQLGAPGSNTQRVIEDNSGEKAGYADHMQVSSEMH